YFLKFYFSKEFNSVDNRINSKNFSKFFLVLISFINYLYSKRSFQNGVMIYVIHPILFSIIAVLFFNIYDDDFSRILVKYFVAFSNKINALMMIMLIFGAVGILLHAIQFIIWNSDNMNNRVYGLLEKFIIFIKEKNYLSKLIFSLDIEKIKQSKGNDFTNTIGLAIGELMLVTVFLVVCMVGLISSISEIEDDSLIILTYYGMCIGIQKIINNYFQ
ncbi:TPA: hypothetical protein ACGO5Q_001890, partial [Streptococcus suis]